MGWNAGYTVLEAQVIALYDLGVLTAAALDALLQPFRGTDIDSGGARDLVTKSGLTFNEVLLEVAGSPETRGQLALLKAAAPAPGWLDKNYQEEQSEQSAEYNAAQNAEWAYDDALYKAIRDITQF